MKIKDITGDFIINYCVEHKDVKWLKKTSAANKNFIALRTLFLNRYDEFKDLRPKAGKKPLYERIAELEE